jgi:hypothetical protein
MDPATIAMLMQMLHSQGQGGQSGQSGQGSSGGFGGGGFGPGLAQLFSGMFGHSDKPYKEGQDVYKNYLDQATQAQQPYNQAGQNALPQYQDLIKKMSDPSGFINNLMGQYQESPFAKYQQQQGIRAAQNVGSASGLTGSSALQNQVQQNAQNISSQDMQNWLGKALGINTEALGGYGNLVSGGQNSANMLSNLFNQGGENMSQFAYNQGAAHQQDQGNIFGGLAKLFGFG